MPSLKTPLAAAGLALALAAALLLAPPPRADAAGAIANFGVDIKPDGTAAQVGFYDGQPAKGGDDGVTLNSARPEIEVTVQTPGLASANLEGFELFFDAEEISGNDSADLFHYHLFDTGKGYVRIASPGDTKKPLTRVPVEGGPLFKHVNTAYASDLDNSFMPSNPPWRQAKLGGSPALADYADELKAGALKVKISVGSPTADARFDGLNLQVRHAP